MPLKIGRQPSPRYPTQLHRKPDERGQVLVGVALVSLVIMVALSTMSMALVSSVGVSARTADDTTAANTAQSGMDWFYSQLELCPNWFLTSNTCTNGSWSPISNLAWAAAGTPGPWVQLTSTGSIQGCPPTDNNCFQITAQSVSSDYSTNNPAQVGSIVGPDQVRVLVTGRSDCRTTSVYQSSSQCVESSYQSVIRRRAYLDYLYFTNYETMAPEFYTPYGVMNTTSPADWSVACDTQTIPGAQSGCIYPAYQEAGNAGDLISGPVFTNSQQIWVCGAPTFTLVQDTGSQGWDESSDCPISTSMNINPSQVPAIPFPSPTDDQDLAAIAAGNSAILGNGQNSVNWYFVPPTNGVVQIIGNGDGTVTVSGSNATIPITGTPTDGVIYVDGPVQVYGSFTQPTTIATASGYNIIVGGLATGQATNLCAPTCNVPPTVPVGLIAGNDVVLYDQNFNAGTPGMEVDAAMMSLGYPLSGAAVTSTMTIGTDTVPTVCSPSDPFVQLATSNSLPGCGTIYLYQWAAEPTAGTDPTLTVVGAMISQYRGVFGTYDASSGALVSGEYKKFSWNSSMLQQQPPYFLQPTYAEWAQTGLQSVGSPQAGANIG